MQQINVNAAFNLDMLFIEFFLLQVWFQNRRMKDKRQKMTLSWPCGDPVLAAYVLQAAAASGQLPYPGLFAAANFGLLPPRPPHPPPPHPAPFPPPASSLHRPTPTLIPPPPAPPAHPSLLLADRKSPVEEVSEDENSKKTDLKTPATSLFQPYLDIEKK